MSIPILHKCSKYLAEGRRQFVGQIDQCCIFVLHATHQMEENPQTFPNIRKKVVAVSESPTTTKTKPLKTGDQ